MSNEDNYKKRKQFDPAYCAPMKKSNKIKEERRKSQENEDVVDQDSEMENDDKPGNNQVLGEKSKKQMITGKLGKLKPKRGRKYKILKGKNKDGSGIQSKYKRKKITAIPNAGAANILSPNSASNLTMASTLLGAPTPTTSKRQMKSKERKDDIDKGKTGKKIKLRNNETITSDEDEMCSLSNCARPTGLYELFFCLRYFCKFLNSDHFSLVGSEVDWVQCDGGCNKWFHMYCVGIDKTQIKPDEDFICNFCKKVTTPSSTTTVDPSSDNTTSSLTDTSTTIS